MDKKYFMQLPLMGILRGISSDAVAPLTEAVISSGLKHIEITMNTAGAPELIQQMVTVAAGRLTVGAGTVLSVDDVKRALDAGATFIVSPTLIPEVIDYCTTHAIAVFPGAFTPQEIFAAWKAGATMVKVFPVKFFGPAYFKEIKGPFNNIKLLACGGVSAETIGQYFASGASAVAFGASVFKKELLDANNVAPIKKDITALIEAYRATQK
ncbi:bifunctional 4-hydroxy-2-oxoglutarate aldolase/2-dehydro-3-deoxy-phosphogluconate aldolase [Candidatus Omnitrophota bacterium]